MEKVSYHKPLENVLKQITEKSQALAWAHDAASNWCKTWDTRISLTSIVLGLFAGTGAVASDNLLPFHGNTTLVGIVSLIVTMIQAINNKLAFAKRAESHRQTSLAYSQIYNKLNLQLNTPRHERQIASELLTYIQSETERLTEIEPSFPTTIKELFHKRFHELKDYSMPLTLNGLSEVTVIQTLSSAPSITDTPIKTSEGIKIGIEV